ncbi:serine hydrolase domain-containing protein [Kribbella sp. NPDC051620]|uniref:serine hydrolase domain-containing protein n=1 Tax=Kribbella sp. NPDC051620 TaxID=3364120 RepID=UPI0037B72091
MFESVWRSLEQQVAAGWAPGIVAGIRHQGRTEYFATGTLSFDPDHPLPMRADTRFRIASLSKPVGAAVALSMVADGLFDLDDPVAPWLPELAEPRVLRTPGGSLDQTVPADRPITVRQLLTMTFGLGSLSSELQKAPIADALGSALGYGLRRPFDGDEFMARLSSVPLVYQPGARFIYHSGFDVLSVLIARVAGRPLHAVLEERINAPLGLTSTSFQADGATLPTTYRMTERGLEAFPEYDEAFAEPPPFESFGGGLVSTVEDQLTFLQAIAEGSLLPAELLRELTTDQLTDEQRAGLGAEADRLSWSLGFGVELAVTDPWTAVGRYGWSGGSGTSAATDPSRELIGVVLTQRMIAGPQDDFAYFWQPLAESLRR